MTNETELDEQAAKRAEHVRAKRTERADPEGRVERLADQRGPVNGLDLPEVPDDAGTDSDEPNDEQGADQDPFSLDDLPPELYEDIEDVRKKVTYGLREEFGVEIDSEEHFWPLVVHLGVEKLRTMWLAEVVDTYEEVDELETPEKE